MKRILLVAMLAFVFCGNDAWAQRGRGGGGRSSGRSSPGTGSSRSSTSVRGYVRSNGRVVAPSRRSTPDHSFRNNFSTKGNVNPSTGKKGTRITPRRR